MAEPIDFKYGEIYEFHTRKSDEAKEGVYVGNNLRGRGILIHKLAWTAEAYTFNIRDATLEGKLIGNVPFNTHSLTDKEESYALEILNKKSL